MLGNGREGVRDVAAARSIARATVAGACSRTCGSRIASSIMKRRVNSVLSTFSTQSCTTSRNQDVESGRECIAACNIRSLLGTQDVGKDPDLAIQGSNERFAGA